MHFGAAPPQARPFVPKRAASHTSYRREPSHLARSVTLKPTPIALPPRQRIRERVAPKGKRAQEAVHACLLSIPPFSLPFSARACCGAPCEATPRSALKRHGGGVLQNQVHQLGGKLVRQGVHFPAGTPSSTSPRILMLFTRVRPPSLRLLDLNVCRGHKGGARERERQRRRLPVARGKVLDLEPVKNTIGIFIRNTLFRGFLGGSNVGARTEGTSAGGGRSLGR